jgi:hypothetical protein
MAHDIKDVKKRIDASDEGKFIRPNCTTQSLPSSNSFSSPKTKFKGGFSISSQP